MSGYSAPVNSPFDPKAPDLAPETPGLEHVIEGAMMNVMSQLNVCMPARVTKRWGDQTVDLQLLPRTLYTTETTTVDKPIIQRVPVSVPMGANWAIIPPVAVGDLGLALFADRNLDAYLDGDGTSTYDPADTRMHDFSDAIFLPGLPTKSQQSDEQGDLVLRNGKMEMRIKPDGRVVLKNNGQELLDLMDQLMGSVADLANTLATQAFTPTLMGPQGFIASTVAALTDIKTQVLQQKENLETLKDG